MPDKIAIVADFVIAVSPAAAPEVAAAAAADRQRTDGKHVTKLRSIPTSGKRRKGRGRRKRRKGRGRRKRRRKRKVRRDGTNYRCY